MYSATTSDTQIKLVYSHRHLGTTLILSEDSDELAQFLKDILDDPDHPTDTALANGARLIVSETGVAIRSNKGNFNVPWRYIRTLTDDLS